MTILNSNVSMGNNTTIVLEKINTIVVGFANTFVLDYLTMKYGDRLRIAREHKNISQDELASLSGVKQGTISKIERGDQNSSGFDAVLSHTLDIEAMWLYTGRDEFAPDWLMPEGKGKKLPSYIVKSIEALPDADKMMIIRVVSSLASQTAGQESETTTRPSTQSAPRALGPPPVRAIEDRNAPTRERDRPTEDDARYIDKVHDRKIARIVRGGDRRKQCDDVIKALDPKYNKSFTNILNSFRTRHRYHDEHKE